MTFGWIGKILRVDLSDGIIKSEGLSEEAKLSYIGGRGLNAKILFEELDPGADPLGPENVLVFSTGPLVGTMFGGGRFHVSAKSPLSGIIGDGNGGGHWGPELKFAGYDGIIIKGKAERPTYLLIEDGRAELRDAGRLWGKTTWETEELIKRELGDRRLQIVSIGPAGEKLVKYAQVICNMSRSAGRGGMGAVMGSKNLKAIAVRGTGGIKLADPQKLMDMFSKVNEKLKPVYEEAWMVKGRPNCVWTSIGSNATVYSAYGTLGTRNYQSGEFEGIREISAELFREKYAVKPRGCHGCVVNCSQYYEIKDGPYAGTYGDAFETTQILCLGARLGIRDLEAILMLHSLTDQLGLEVIDLCGAIGFAMECYQRGILTERDADGLSLSWGDPEVVKTLIKKIAKREGIGDLLAEGVRHIASKLGRGSEAFAMHAKGLSFHGADYRGYQAWALSHAVSSCGSQHMRALPFGEAGMPPDKAERIFGSRAAADRLTPEGKGPMVAWYEDFRAVADSLVTCKFFPKVDEGAFDYLAAVLNAVTGLRMTGNELRKVGERVINIERCFNIKHAGLSRKDDTLPRRMLEEPLRGKGSEGQVVRLEPMLDQYYEARGWDVKTGIPKRAKLEELGLREAADELGIK
ncbi:MAG: aldehyde ferredoxin oxidoreductase family protein [Candidatus Bathyarchaeia archaeon]